MFGFFVDLKNRSFALLAEFNSIRDEVPGGSTVQAFAGLLEANRTYKKYHNLKVSYDYRDADNDISKDHQVRYRAVWNTHRSGFSRCGQVIGRTTASRRLMHRIEKYFSPNCIEYSRLANYQWNDQMIRAIHTMNNRYW